MNEETLVICHKCGTYHSTMFSAKETRESALDAGWMLGFTTDYCPKCADELKAGNKKRRLGSE